MESRSRTVLGRAELRSLPVSREWKLISDGGVIAELRRFPRRRMSSVKLADGTVWTVAPQGWGVVRAMEGDEEVARISRRSWWGRRWEIESVGFAAGLVSRARPRRWDLTVGDQPIAELKGSILSYNKVLIDATLSIPVVAVVLAWQVIARPWEQAAHGVVPASPRSLTAS